ncbi:MAG TPA: dihydrofolate reductase family protein [Bacteroidota bacterium]|jgi:riboflavin biosynthesis pyrimidine reductase|nr:dihydrofolate reductase family protein [Bacteroidota bacterium]
MTNILPLETLYDDKQGKDLPLTDALASLYGSLRFPPVSRPYVISNFVSSLDGVVSLGVPGNSGGDGISGKNRQDHAVMGLLRALSDAIIIGSKNLAASPRHNWSAERVFPEFADEYRILRQRMKKPGLPVNVVVSGTPQMDFTLPIFQSTSARALIVTTDAGAAIVDQEKLPSNVQIVPAGEGPLLRAEQIVGAVLKSQPDTKIILLEGGPHLLGTFFAEKALDELFLTLSPLVAGRGREPGRLGLVEGNILAPDRPAWGKIVSVKRAENHLFLRYRYPY